MRIKVTHVTLGLCHEVYLVCTAKEEEYFKEVAEQLHHEYAVKTGLYVYDRDPLTDRIKWSLSHCYFVLFTVTPAVVERAVADENDPFRRTYAFVDRFNPNAISLMSVSGESYPKGVEYPKEMSSFYWLHRKRMLTAVRTPKMIAMELYSEFRRHHNHRDQQKMKKLASHGVVEYYDLYHTVMKLLWWLVGLALVSPLLGLLADYIAQQTGGYVVPLKNVVDLLSGLAAAAAVFGQGPVLMYAFYRRDRILDVSTVFHDFKRLTVIRLSVLASIAIAGYQYLLLQGLETVLTATADSGSIRLWGLGLCMLPVIVQLVKVMILRHRLGFTYGDGEGFLQYGKFRFRIHLIFLGVYALLALALRIVFKQVFGI